MVHLSDIQDPPSGSSSASAPQSAHTHAFPTPPPSPPLGSASASTSTSTCPKSQPMYNDPPDLPLPPPGLPPAPPSPPTLIQLANSLSKLPPESYTSRRRLLHLATTSGRALRGAVVTWDDPAGGALVCLAWLALCLSARPLLVLAPHMTAMSVLVANYPGTHATAQRGAATRRQVKVQRAAPGPRVTVALDADHDIAWSTTLADLSSVSRTLGRARALASTPVALAAWTDPDASLAALWLVVSTFPLWIGLHLALPVHHAVGVAGLAPLCAGLVPKVLKSLPDAPLGNASVPGEWRPHEHEHKMWIGFGVGVYVTRYRVYPVGPKGTAPCSRPRQRM